MHRSTISEFVDGFRKNVVASWTIIIVFKLKI